MIGNSRNIATTKEERTGETHLTKASDSKFDCCSGRSIPGMVLR